MALFGNGKPEDHGKSKNAWEHDVLEKLVFSAIKEQRTSRRWSYLFKGLILLYLTAVLAVMMPDNDILFHNTEHTALVEINGIIAADADANADVILTAVRDAFNNEGARGLILRINTPGGSPVQAGIINDEIKRLQKTRPDFPVYAVIQDICASGGYYIAVAAQEIYANKASIVGSIGVRMDGFGFVDAISSLGVTRRSLTAGENKAFLDPFLPIKNSDVQHARAMISNVHQQFIDIVKAGRGDRLANDETLFSGLVWSGEQALPLGLIDGLANSSTVARDKIGAENIINYTPSPDYLDNFIDKLGITLSQRLLNKLGTVAIR